MKEILENTLMDLLKDNLEASISTIELELLCDHFTKRYSAYRYCRFKRIDAQLHAVIPNVGTKVKRNVSTLFKAFGEFFKDRLHAFFITELVLLKNC